MTTVSIILIVIAVLLIGWIATVYNRFITLRNRQKEAWSIMDVFLKKRSDLIPNLVATVKGYAQHEKTLFEQITQFRAQAIEATNTTSRMNAESGVGRSLGKLMIAVENYPALKANENFLSLQNSITEVETDLERSRRYYNGVVRDNNIAIESFPANLVANMFGFRRGIFFNVADGVGATPQISL